MKTENANQLKLQIFHMKREKQLEILVEQTTSNWIHHMKRKNICFAYTPGPDQSNITEQIQNKQLCRKQATNGLGLFSLMADEGARGAESWWHIV